MLNKSIFVVALLLLPTPALANEIAGTRVSGDVEITCPAGAGRGVEMNVTTKEIWSYCFELYRPTLEESRTRIEERIAETITTRKNPAPEVVESPDVVVVDVTPITERLNKVEINATTGVTTVSELTTQELAQLAIDKAINQARDTARNQAQTNAQANVGVEQCVNWQSNVQSGKECAFEPVRATEGEVTDFYETLRLLFADTDWWLWYSW